MLSRVANENSKNDWRERDFISVREFERNQQIREVEVYKSKKDFM